jgi:hypothetical protein
VLIMAGMYSAYSKWINKEIEIAKRMGKVIIAIKPFGAERISTVVTPHMPNVRGTPTASSVPFASIRRCSHAQRIVYRHQ